MIAQSVHFYNQKCPHFGSKYKMPDAVHQAFLDF